MKPFRTYHFPPLHQFSAARPAGASAGAAGGNTADEWQSALADGYRQGQRDGYEVGLDQGRAGGIAAGKSVVGEMFVALGAHLVQADRIAHSLMQPGEPVYNEVVRHFGREILNPDGSLNRAKLAELAFGTSSSAGGKPAPRIAELNRIVHPVVIRS